jgi:hypothetical protein
MQRWRATEVVIDSSIHADMVKCEHDGYYLASDVDAKLAAVEKLLDESMELNARADEIMGRFLDEEALK